MTAALKNSRQRGDAESDFLATVLGVLLFLALVVCWIIWGDSDAEARAKAKAAVEASGFANVTITDRAILACGENDAYRFRWRGENVAGKQVEGQACAGWFFKGWTVRIER